MEAILRNGILRKEIFSNLRIQDALNLSSVNKELYTYQKNNWMELVKRDYQAEDIEVCRSETWQEKYIELYQLTQLMSQEYSGSYERQGRRVILESLWQVYEIREFHFIYKCPIGVCRLIDLESLILGFTIGLPDQIQQLKKLNNLMIIHSPRINFSNLNQLENLTQLEICNSNITNIPKEACQLKNLEVLCLCLNNIKSIPKEINQLTNLRNLCLCNNQIREIPIEVSHLTNLRILRLQYNIISKIATEIFYMNLYELNISYNCLWNLTIPSDHNIMSINGIKSDQFYLTVKIKEFCNEISQTYLYNKTMRILLPAIVGYSFVELYSYCSQFNYREHGPFNFIISRLIEYIGLPSISASTLAITDHYLLPYHIPYYKNELPILFYVSAWTIACIKYQIVRPSLYPVMPIVSFGVSYLFTKGLDRLHKLFNRN